jgi:hypothetical protein
MSSASSQSMQSVHNSDDDSKSAAASRENQATPRQPSHASTSHGMAENGNEDENCSRGNAPKTRLSEVLPKTGLVYSDRGSIAEVMCKPILLPLKSVGLQHIEEQERLAATAGKSQVDEPNAVQYES